MSRSHHFIGIGPLSDASRQGAERPEVLAAQVTGHIERSGLHTISHHEAGFGQGGTTLVWILAESHLVVHLWAQEGYATVDLHVCDYKTSNALAAHTLKQGLNGLCFRDGQGDWKELSLEHPETP